MSPDSDGHHPAITAFVAEHHDQLEKFADSRGETAKLVEALLGLAETDTRTEGGGQ